MLNSLRRVVAVSVLSTACAIAGGSTFANGFVHAKAAGTATVWLQTFDACDQAVPGASFALSGSGLDRVGGPGPGIKPVTVAVQPCPLQRGNCTSVPTGCVWWTLEVPGAGTRAYTIHETTTPSGYAACTGGSACRSESAQLTVDPTGRVSARVTNVEPDGTTEVWPTSGTYSGAVTDPIVFHDFALGSGSCDGDADQDDRLSGVASAHCDADADPAVPPSASPTPPSSGAPPPAAPAAAPPTAAPAAAAPTWAVPAPSSPPPDAPFMAMAAPAFSATALGAALGTPLIPPVSPSTDPAVSPLPTPAAALSGGQSTASTATAPGTSADGGGTIASPALTPTAGTSPAGGVATPWVGLIAVLLLGAGEAIAVRRGFIRLTVAAHPGGGAGQTGGHRAVGAAAPGGGGERPRRASDGQPGSAPRGVRDGSTVQPPSRARRRGRDAGSVA
jgi:hypothetical protein